MRTTHRGHSEEQGDFRRLSRFFMAVGGTHRRYSTWCLGRIVDWKYALNENKRTYASFCEKNAHLWFDGFGELVGFAISESGDAGFHALTLECMHRLKELGIRNVYITGYSQAVIALYDSMGHVTEFRSLIYERV